MLPSEALEALGVEEGAEVEIEIVGRALVVRSINEARRSRQLLNVFESILTKRRSVYQEFAEDSDR